MKGKRLIFSTIICLIHLTCMGFHCEADSLKFLIGVHDAYAMLSADKTKIVFHGDRMGHNDIYIMNSDGTSLKRLTDNPANDRTPALSPDGRKIAFVSTRDGNYDVFVMNVDGSGQQNLTKNALQKDIHPYWSPDGTKIIFNSSRVNDTYNIYTMDPDGTHQTMVQENTEESTHAQISPDGKRIVFRRFIVDEKYNSEIFVCNIDGTDEQRITKNNAVDYHPSWSPDGTRIAFVSDRDSEQENIFVLTLADGGLRKVTQSTHAVHYMTPTWISGTDLLVTYYRMEFSTIASINILNDN